MAEQNTSISAVLSTNLENVESALPKDLNRERFVQNCLAVLNDPEKRAALQKCNQSSIVQALVKGAYLGLDFMNSECYIIPYGGMAKFQTSYLGEIKFTKKYSERRIKDIYAKLVRDGDYFQEEIRDGQPSIDFKPLPFNKGEIIGVFAVCLFEDGGMLYETMTIEDVNATRQNYSKASNSPAWKNSFGEMAKKVCLRRLTKHITTNFESIEARNAWQEGGDADFTTGNVHRKRSDEVVDAFGKKEEPPTIVDVKAEEVVDSAPVEEEPVQVASGQKYDNEPSELPWG